MRTLPCLWKDDLKIAIPKNDKIDKISIFLNQIIHIMSTEILDSK